MSLDPTRRLVILPAGAASEIITSAIARAGWAVSLVVVVAAAPVLIDVLSHRDRLSGAVWPLVALAALLVLLLLAPRVHGWALRVLHTLAIFAAATAYTSTLLDVEPDLTTNAIYLLNRAAVAALFLAPGAMRPLSGFVWSVAGLVLSVGSLELATVVMGTPFSPGAGPFIAWAIYGSAYLVTGLVQARQSTRVPNLDRLEEETERMKLEGQFELRAAAMVHDTILSDLTSIMLTAGALDDRARDRFTADVGILKSRTWLRESAESIAVDEQDGALRLEIIALASQMQWRGFKVEVSGSTSAPVRMSVGQRSALIEAVRECLANVFKHSGAQSAELVLAGSVEEITCMIVDQGEGFEPLAVPADRLGIRNSVVGRVEAQGGSVRIWSKPGSGTSVLVSMPNGTVSNGTAEVTG